MKQKIKEAVQQLNKTLGLSESTVDGLVSFAMTVVKDESEIEGFVNSEAFKGLLKSYQSEADKVRTKTSDSKKAEYEAKIAELEAKLNGNNPPEPNPEPKPQDTPDIAALIEAALDKKLNPITERLNNFETAQSQKSAIAALDELKATWDYAQGFPEESEYAYNMAMGIYNGIGKTWTAEQLTAKYKETFNERVSKKGIDTTKPFQSDGGAGDNIDFSQDMKDLQEMGLIAKESETK